MTDAEAIGAFVGEALEDWGATVSARGGILWAQLPPALAAELALPADLVMTTEPESVGAFGAELLAPGSYVLERLLERATRRGRWDTARVTARSEDWIASALRDAGLPPSQRFTVIEVRDAPVVLFLFRVSLVSDEKWESCHAIGVCPDDKAGWSVGPDIASAPLEPSSAPSPLDIDGLYRTARETLCRRIRSDLDRFRRTALGLLEEEVRRILGYFDRTEEAIRQTGSSATPGLLLALEAERDRRLAEALERFDARALATLIGVRAVFAPVAHVALDLRGREGGVVTVDAWTRVVRGLRCDACHRSEGPWARATAHGLRCVPCAARAGESARPPIRPRSDIPRPRTKAGRASARSPLGSRERFRSSDVRRRGP